MAIEGYDESMSADDELALLEKQNTNLAPTKDGDESRATSPAEENKTKPKPVEKTVSKQQYDALASEVAKYKRELRAKQTEDEIKASELEETRAKEQEELEMLRKEKKLMSYKASFLGLGYDEGLASEASEALSENDMNAVFATMKKYSAGVEKALRAKILKETPVPPAGNKDDRDKDPFIEAFKNG
jgi:hypothetical protein